MRTSIILFLLAFIAPSAFATGLLLVDTKSGTVKFPPVLEQVRYRLLQNNNVYSFMEGDLVVYRKVNATTLCLEFSSQAAHAEMKARISAGFVSPEGSPYPSALEVTEVDSCLQN